MRDVEELDAGEEGLVDVWKPDSSCRSGTARDTMCMGHGLDDDSKGTASHMG